MSELNKEELFDKLLRIYGGSFDVKQPYVIKGDSYDAYAFCNITSAKYVLIKKAELWRALCYEHVFFRLYDQIEVSDIAQFQDSVETTIEPDLVRKGQATMEKDHMYTYVTGIFLCDGGVSEEVKKKIKQTRFYKNYRLSVRGYCELRLLVVDLKNRKLIGNRAARDLIKDYKKFL